MDHLRRASDVSASGTVNTDVRFARMSVDGFVTATAARLVPKTLPNSAWISPERRWRGRAR